MSDRGGRLTVRATVSFFENLDRQLPSTRGTGGDASVNDFQVFELLRIIERFATGFYVRNSSRGARTIGSS